MTESKNETETRLKDATAELQALRSEVEAARSSIIDTPDQSEDDVESKGRKREALSGNVDKLQAELKDKDDEIAELKAWKQKVEQEIEVLAGRGQ